jgi:TetR/AcrR family transcriptional regulator, transcriptional repressor for nem operon
MARTKAFHTTAVLERAMQTFWRCGYAATSMQDLVDSMGINRQSIYDTFGDKHQLFLQTLEHYRCGAARYALEPLTLQQPLEQALRELFARLIAESVADADSKGCFIANATLELSNQDTALAAFVQQNWLESVAFFERRLALAKQLGELGEKHDVNALAMYLFHSIGGLRLVAKTTKDRATLESLVETTLLAFL